MPALQPGAGIGDESERGRMAFRKSVTAEALKLLENLLGKDTLVAFADHSIDELVLEGADAAAGLECRHALAQLVGLARREPGTLDRHPLRLFLKQRHTECVAEHLLQFRRRIMNRLQPFAPPEIGMNHVTLNRSRADDRHLDDEIVKGAW